MIDDKFVEFLKQHTTCVIVTNDLAGNDIVPLNEITDVHEDHFVHDGEKIPFSHSVLWIGVKGLLVDARSQEKLGSRVGTHFFDDVSKDDLDDWANASQVAKLGVGLVICTCDISLTSSNRIKCRFFFKSENDAILARAALS